jgi:hypothetical protein
MVNKYTWNAEPAESAETKCRRISQRALRSNVVFFSQVCGTPLVSAPTSGEQQARLEAELTKAQADSALQRRADVRIEASEGSKSEV